MRELANSSRIELFMRELGRAVDVDGRVYLTGGATAVLYGWRDTTIDVDQFRDQVSVSSDHRFASRFIRAAHRDQGQPPDG